MARTTYTVVLLPLSATAYQEIRRKLAAAGYEHTFITERDGTEYIDMHGIGVQSEPQEEDGHAE